MRILKETKDMDKMLLEISKKEYWVVQSMNKSDVFTDRSVTDCFGDKKTAEAYYESKINK